MPTKVGQESANGAQNTAASTQSTSRFSAFKEKVVSTLKSIFHLQTSGARPIGQRGVQVGSAPKKSPLKELTNADYFKGHDTFQPSLVKKNLGVGDLPGLTSHPAYKKTLREMEELLADESFSPAAKQKAFKEQIAPKFNTLLKESGLSYADKFGLNAANGKAFVASLKAELGKDVVGGKQEWFEAAWSEVFDGKGTSEFYHQAVLGLGETAKGNFRGTEKDLEGSTIKIGKKTFEFKGKVGGGAYGLAARYVRSKAELAEEKKNGIKSSGPAELVVKVPQLGPRVAEHQVLLDGPIQEMQVHFDVVGTGASAENFANAQDLIRTDDGVVLTVLGVAKNGSFKGLNEKIDDAVRDDDVSKSSAAKFKLGVARDILRALQRLRSAVGVVHFDLAARNVLIDGKGRGKLADFGLSQKLEGDKVEGAKIAKTGGMAPIRWTSPERLNSGAVDTKTDVWSFGAMLMELATGKAPFSELETNDDVMAEVTKPDFDITPYLNGITEGDFPEEEAAQLTTLLKKIFSSNPSERPSLEEILADPLFALDESELETARTEVLEKVGVAQEEENEEDASDGYGVPIPVAYREVRPTVSRDSSSGAPVVVSDDYGNEFPVSQIAARTRSVDYNATVERSPDADYNATVERNPDPDYNATVERSADPDYNVTVEASPETDYNATVKRNPPPPSDYNITVDPSPPARNRPRRLLDPEN